CSTLSSLRRKQPGAKENRRVKEYDIYVPRNYNDGSPVEKEKLKRVKQLLTDEFGGVTQIRLEKRGWWRTGAVIFRDKIDIFRVFGGNTRRARGFLRRLKEHLRDDLNREEILIVEKEAKLLQQRLRADSSE